MIRTLQIVVQSAYLHNKLTLHIVSRRRVAKKP